MKDFYTDLQFKVCDFKSAVYCFEKSRLEPRGFIVYCLDGQERFAGRSTSGFYHFTCRNLRSKTDIIQSFFDSYLSFNSTFHSFD